MVQCDYYAPTMPFCEYVLHKCKDICKAADPGTPVCVLDLTPINCCMTMDSRRRRSEYSAGEQICRL